MRVSNVLALVPQESATMLATAVPRGAVTVVHGLSAFQQHIERLGADVVIVDPATMRAEAFSELLGMLSDAGAPLVIWSPLTAVTASRALAASRVLAVEVVFRDYELSSRLLRALVRNSAWASVPALVLRGLSNRFVGLPPQVRTPTVGIFGGATIPSSIRTFSVLACCSRRTLERSFQHAGLSSVKRLLDVARLSRSWSALQDDTRSIADAADIVGYRSGRTFAERYRKLIGVSPRRASHILTAETVAASLVQAACTQGLKGT